MLILALIVIGCVIMIALRTYQTNRRKSKFIDVLYAAEKREAAQKARFSLYEKIRAVSQMLKLDQLVPISRQTEESRFRPSLSPWEQKEGKAPRTNHGPTTAISKKAEYSIRDDMRLFGRYFSP